MHPFFFLFRVVPEPENEKAKDVLYAYAHIWVIDNNFENAEKRARHYVEEYLWKIEEVELARRILPEQLANLDKVEESGYQKARRYGISALFSAVPIEPRDPDTFEFRKLT